MTTPSLLPPLDRRRLDWEAAARATLSTVLPLLVLFALGRIDLGIYASFAAFTALYGRGEPYRFRVVTLAVAAGCVFGCVAGGVLVQAVGMPWWLLAAGFTVVVSAGVLLTSVMQWIPRGALFFVFAYLGCAMKPLGNASVGEAVLVAAIVVASSWAIGTSGWLLRHVGVLRARMRDLPRVPERRIRAAWNRGNLAVIVVTLAAGAVAMALALWLGVATHHYWAVVTVVAIFAGPAALVNFDRISHRVIGTLLGVGIAAAAYGGAPHPLYVIAVVTVCVFLTELVVGQHYGLALSFITPLAIGATNLGLTSQWEVLFVDRARETLLGGAVCLVVVVVVRWWRSRRADTVGSDGTLGRSR